MELNKDRAVDGPRPEVGSAFLSVFAGLGFKMQLKSAITLAALTAVVSCYPGYGGHSGGPGPVNHDFKRPGPQDRKPDTS